MTMKFNVGDWVQLRNGKILGPLYETFTGILGFQSETTKYSWMPRGQFFPSGSECELDIIAVVPAPEKLPEPFECFFNVYPDERIYFSAPENALMAVNKWGGKAYRCTVTPIELVKP